MLLFYFYKCLGLLITGGRLIRWDLEICVFTLFLNDTSRNSSFSGVLYHISTDKIKVVHDS